MKPVGMPIAHLVSLARCDEEDVGATVVGVVMCCMRFR